MTMKMLQAGIKNAHWRDFLNRSDTPEGSAYKRGFDRMQLAGAKWFGYPTFWANRLNVPAEELRVAPDAIGRSLEELVKFVMSGR